MVNWTYTGHSNATVVEHNPDNGQTYVGDSDGNIYAINSDGTENWVLSDQSGFNRGIRDIAITSSDSFYYADGADVRLVSTTGNIEATYSAGASPTDLWYSSSVGTYVVSDDELIEIGATFGPLYDADTTYYDFDSITGDGTYLYVGTDNYRVHKHRISDGVRVDTVTVNTERVGDILYHDGFIYVDADNITKIDATDLSIVWEADVNVREIEYDTSEDLLYAPRSTLDNAGIARVDPSDGKVLAEYDAGVPYDDVSIVDASTIVGTQDSQTTSINDNEFAIVLEKLSATQVQSVATMLDTELTFGVVVKVEMNDAQVSSLALSGTQVQGVGAMNVGEISAYDASATQFTVQALSNNSGSLDKLSAVQPTGSATMLTGVTEESTDLWVIEDVDGNEYLASRMRLDDGVPQFRRGQEITRVFIFSDDFGGIPAENIYSNVKDFGRYLTEDSVRTITSYNGVPKYTQNVNPLAETTSYLWKVTPNASSDTIEPWWVVVTNIRDVTRMVGASHALETTMYAVAPVSEGDRTYIQNNFEV